MYKMNDKDWGMVAFLYVMALIFFFIHQGVN